MKIICFDLDNVICKTKGNNYKNSRPDKVAVNLINNTKAVIISKYLQQDIWEGMVKNKKS